MVMGLGLQPQQEHSAIYTLIYVSKHYLQLLNWHKFATSIIFLKTANLIKNWFLSDATSCHRTERPPSPFDQIWRQMDKNLNFQTSQWIEENLELQSRLFKYPTFPSLLWIGKNLYTDSPRPTFQNPNVESMDELEKLMS